MTHDQLQEVRDTLSWLLSKVPMKVQGAAARYETARAMIDAEMARPEERQWRALAVCAGGGSPYVIGPTYRNRRGADEDAALWGSDTKNDGSQYVAVVESRTPAGPWESE